MEEISLLSFLVILDFFWHFSVHNPEVSISVFKPPALLQHLKRQSRLVRKKKNNTQKSLQHDLSHYQSSQIFTFLTFTCSCVQKTNHRCCKRLSLPDYENNNTGQFALLVFLKPNKKLEDLRANLYPKLFPKRYNG